MTKTLYVPEHVARKNKKEKQVNNSSVLGYYMNATFKNFSRGKIELFSVGSEVSESSK